jgi:hypothetical protein
VEEVAEGGGPGDGDGAGRGSGALGGGAQPAAVPYTRWETLLTSRWVTLRARWVTLRARWVTLRARWVTLRARWVTLRARWVTLRARWVTLRARWVTLRARWAMLNRWETARASAIVFPVWFIAQYTFNLSLSLTSVTVRPPPQNSSFIGVSLSASQLGAN